MDNNKIAIVISYIVFLAIPVVAIYLIYRKVIAPIASPINNFFSESKKIINKGTDAIDIIFEPLDESMTEEEKEEYKEVYKNEAIKNILDPREWMTNLSYWWS